MKGDIKKWYVEARRAHLFMSINNPGKEKARRRYDIAWFAGHSFQDLRYLIHACIFRHEE